MGDFLKRYVVFSGKALLISFTIFGIACVFANIGSFNQRLIAVEDEIHELNMRADWTDSRLDYCTKGD